VLIDHVISAIMVTSTLTVGKLESDWRKLQSLPRFTQFEKEFPHLKGHPWPCCYIVGAQSDPIEDLKKTWATLCQEGLTQVVPQFVIALDSGFLYGGWRKWPCPRYPGNYVEADHVTHETDIYGGLGLAWLLLQHQGRLALLNRQPTGPIARFGALLDRAKMREGAPPTYSLRFETAFQAKPIAGLFEWGHVACFAHNRLRLSSLERNRGESNLRSELELYQDGVDAKTLDWQTFSHIKFLRWFRYRDIFSTGRLLAMEEWIDHKSKTNHRSRIAVFDTLSGEEIRGDRIDALKSLNDFETAKAIIEAELEKTDPSTNYVHQKTGG
jgi:hypothetical protein